MEIFPEDWDPAKQCGRLEPEEHAGHAGQVELPASQRDLARGENSPGLVDDEDCGENGGQVPVGVRPSQVTQLTDPDCEGLFHHVSQEAEDDQDPDSRGNLSLLIHLVSINQTISQDTSVEFMSTSSQGIFSSKFHTPLVFFGTQR